MDQSLAGFRVSLHPVLDRPHPSELLNLQLTFWRKNHEKKLALP